MISRYSRKQMSAVWSEEAQYRTWLDIEVLACEAWAKHGAIPAHALSEIKTKAHFTVEEVAAREAETKHDLAAFVSVVQNHVGPAGRFIHLGLTSSDIVDTALAFRLKLSGELLQKELIACLHTVRKNALRDRNIPMMGRTHGIHAEPTTMGLKWLTWHAMLNRSLKRLRIATEEVSVGKLSGAVGNYAHTPPTIEAFVCERLGLKPDTISTQVIPRDRFAAYFAALGLLGSTIETIAVELRHLQRTEVGEVREGFSKGQKGSSAMPHKRNPISAENLTGLGRLLRGMVIPAMENCALWHERDISHSSVERVLAPDANILADYALSRLNTLLEGLEVFPEKMARNLNLLQGVVFSQRVLLGLVEAGLSRDEAYEIVQKNALKAIDSNKPFRDLLAAEPAVVKALPPDRLNMLFDTGHYFQHLDHIFKKVLQDEITNESPHP